MAFKTEEELQAYADWAKQELHGMAETRPQQRSVP